jgi:biopolymer transport protein ExbD
VRIPRPAEAEEPLLAMTSLLDMLFILIVFFLVASTFKEEERDLQVNLPEADPSAALTAAPRVIVVNVRRDGRYVVAEQTLDLPQVLERVRAALAADPDRRVLVRGDRSALHEHVAAAIRACREAGVAHANLGYDCVPAP